MKKACRINGTPSEEKIFKWLAFKRGWRKIKGGRKLFFKKKKNRCIQTQRNINIQV